MDGPQAGGMYRLYTGTACRVVGLANNTENNKTLVIAHKVPDSDGWLAFPLDVFTGKVEGRDGKWHPRFTKIKQR